MTDTPSPIPQALQGVRTRTADDGRRVITNQDAADALETTKENLRQLVRAGKISRETDLDEPKRTWFTVEAVARLYWERFPDRRDEAEDGPQEHTPDTPPRESETNTHELALIVSKLSQSLEPLARSVEPIARMAVANEESKDATIERLSRMLQDATARADRMERERDEALKWRDKPFWDRVNRR